jgi:hypothetical protein
LVREKFPAPEFWRLTVFLVRSSGKQ